MPDRLTDTQIFNKLEALPGWTYKSNSLTRSLQFSNHPEAIAFVVRLAFECERQNHHPELTIVWATVSFRLRTHDADDRVTEQDVLLAHSINELAETVGLSLDED